MDLTNIIDADIFLYNCYIAISFMRQRLKNNHQRGYFYRLAPGVRTLPCVTCELVGCKTVFAVNSVADWMEGILELTALSKSTYFVSSKQRWSNAQAIFFNRKPFSDAPQCSSS
jgi:hypothetical protein